jgi:hydroxymethylbilane synthase
VTARTFVIGTRGSRLALAQTAIVRDALLARHSGARIDVREIKTEGDVSPAPLSVIGGTGVFTKAIEDALLRGDIDIAVHSLKDLPPRIPGGLAIAAVPARGDPRDALVSRDGARLADLPPGARIGTGSARRAAQLRALRDDIEYVEIRGNVDTRIRKVEQGEYDGAVLALAGLQRLGLESKAAQIFTVDEIVPAVGQACLGVELRKDDREAIELARGIDHEDSHHAADAERAFLARLGAGCTMPVGAFARVTGGQLTIAGMLASGEPPQIHRGRESGAASDATAIGRRLAEALIVRVGVEIPAR